MVSGGRGDVSHGSYCVEQPSDGAPLIEEGEQQLCGARNGRGVLVWTVLNVRLEYFDRACL